MPRPSAFVLRTEIVCGNTKSEMKNLEALLFFWSFVLLLKNICIASAAAVDSSSKEAFAKGNPVKSETTVWKLSKASNLPCAISAW